MVQLNFDANTVDPSQPTGTPLPAGWYRAYISESEMMPTKDNIQGLNGNEYLQLLFNLTDWADEGLPPPEKISRKIKVRLNLKNSNAQAVEIAYRDLSAIGHAVGVTMIQDSGQLHDKPLEVLLKIDGTYNAICGYRPLMLHAQNNPGTMTQAAPPPAGNNALWDE